MDTEDTKKASGQFLLRLVGGLGHHIGANCSLLQWMSPQKQHLTTVMIDCGMLMADRKRTGWDAFVPHATRYFPRANGLPPCDPVDALFLTHGHVDHDGGIPYLLKHPDGYKIPPIYCTSLEKYDLIKKCQEMGVAKDKIDDLSFTVIDPWKWVEIGDLKILPFPVPHSYATSLGFYAEAPNGANYINFGDWKIDNSVPLGETLNLRRLRKMIGRDVICATIESTNARFKRYTQEDFERLQIFLEKSGRDKDLQFTMQAYDLLGRGAAKGKVIQLLCEKNERIVNEADVKAAFKKLHDDYPDRRIVVFTMSRNHQRLATLCDVAKDSGRTIEVTGAAIQTSVSVMKKAGIDFWERRGERAFFNSAGSKTIGTLTEQGRHGQMMVWATGSNGEAIANLARATRGEIDERLKLDTKNDVIVISATIIPGNEENLFPLVKKLLQEKHKVIIAGHSYGKDLESKLQELIKLGLEIRPELHASGHIAMKQLRSFYGFMRRRFGLSHCIPIHGGDEQRMANYSLIKENGVKPIALKDGGEVIILPPTSRKPGEVRKVDFVSEATLIGAQTDGFLGDKQIRFADNPTTSEGLAVDAGQEKMRTKVKLEIVSDLPISKDGVVLVLPGAKNPWHLHGPSRPPPRRANTPQRRRAA